MSSGELRPVWLDLERILDRRIWVMYLVIIDRMRARFREQIQARPDERFFKVLNEHVSAYVKDNVEPPDEIASVVMNVADDIMSGRDVTMRAGDYIAVQNFIRK